MKHTTGKSIRIAVTGILFLLLLTGSASALKERKLTASCPSVSGEQVTAQWKQGEMTLYLPGVWDLTKIRLTLEDSETILLGDEKTAVSANEESDLSGFTGRKLKVLDGGGEGRGTLTILQGSRIPGLFLEVDGEELKKVNRSKDNVITEGRAVYTEADGSVSYTGGLDQLKGRGNNTFRYSKKPYQIKLAEKASLSGMGKGRTWVLLANWTDLSLLRNQIVLDMSREIGLRNAVSCTQADVWINGAYQGLYLVTEKIQIGKGRIDIANLEKETEKVNGYPFEAGKIVTEKSAAYPLLRSYPQVKDPEDITGGYIMTIEKKHRMKDYVLAGFRTENELSIQIKEPTYPSRGQAEYLFARITEMQNALIAEDGTEPATGKRYDEYLDVQSFARRFLIEDWCKNYDFIGGSQFLYKDSDLNDPLIYAGPSWDYDLCFGNMEDRGYPATGKYLTSYRKKTNLYWLLYSHEDFRNTVGDIWQNSFRQAAAVLLGEKEAEPEGVIRSLDEYAEQIRDSAAMNSRRWPGGGGTTGRGAGGDFDNAIRYMKEWISARTEWMDGEYGTVAPENAQ
ncbi:CotH kinase family protein [Aristaeella lactis]|uniref:CotH protein n=1 Tax=Aristaeella lactis TaxID=3046383 RepID=A0AC61PJL4_9FIRM|nr:CotH kinase family protein [Aristaeella lactis]QUA51657.1 CotH kinase family protein [Aristaeella lactis]SMC48612.1 CotH protein [Aristaeella lactis]